MGAADISRLAQEATIEYVTLSGDIASSDLGWGSKVCVLSLKEKSYKRHLNICS